MFSRTIKLIGAEHFSRLQSANVLVAGVGGVGGYVAESLVRSGVGSITLADYDIIDITNINRQIIATQSTIGLSKVQAFKTRLLDINPQLNITVFDCKIDINTITNILNAKYTFIADCIDDVKNKALLIKTAHDKNINIISALGAGNKITSDFIIGDLYSCTHDALAKALRKQLRDSGIQNHICAYHKHTNNLQPTATKPIASISYAPAIMGLKISEYIINNT